MKLLYTIILCLCAVGGYSQMSHSNVNDGTYLFKEATFVSYNNETRTKLEEKNLKPESLNEHDIFYQNLFKEVAVYNQLLTFCVLFNDKDYIVTDELTLSLAKEYNESEEQQAFLPSMLTPYTLSVDNGVATFTARYLYGDPKHNSTLEGILTVKLIKQK